MSDNKRGGNGLQPNLGRRGFDNKPDSVGGFFRQFTSGLGLFGGRSDLPNISRQGNGVRVGVGQGVRTAVGAAAFGDRILDVGKRLFGGRGRDDRDLDRDPRDAGNGDTGYRSDDRGARRDSRNAGRRDAESREQPMRYDSQNPYGGKAPESSANPRRQDDPELAKFNQDHGTHLSRQTVDALNEFKSIEGDEKFDYFNNLSAKEKNEIAELSRLETKGVDNPFVLDAKGNIDEANYKSVIEKNSKKPIAAAQPAPIVKTVSVEASSAATPETSTLESRAAGFMPGLGDELKRGAIAQTSPPSVSKFTPTAPIEKIELASLKSGQVVDAKFLNQLSAQGYFRPENHMFVGQPKDPSAIRVLMDDNKIVGALKDDKFVSRADLDTQLAAKNQSVAGIESARSGVQDHAASKVEIAAVETPALKPLPPQPNAIGGPQG